MHRLILILRYGAILLFCGCSLAAEAGDEYTAALASGPSFKRIELPGIHNVFQVTDRVYSGSQPEGEEAFSALAKLGIKTLISVDGAKPDLDVARRYGLRYIHLPFGYDGVPTSRVVELAKAAQFQPGPVFVHCHHGLHRGPAAVAVICQATENWTPDQAQTWMHEAGTASDYAGLYRSTTIFKQPTREQLAAVKVLPEVTMPSGLVETMLAIDEHFSRLKQLQKQSRKTTLGHADITPEHEALMLWEKFQEMSRTTDTAGRPSDYRAKLRDTEVAVESFRQSLRKSEAPPKIDASFAKLGPTCAACHRCYRN